VLDIPRHLADDFPMTLDQACKLEFGGAIKPGTLKAEHRRGNLVLERIGNKDFVTRIAIREMRRKCQVDQSERARDFGFSQSARIATAASRPHGGSSVTATQSAALDALKVSVAGLKRH
jgi:hypothetical protein